VRRRVHEKAAGCKLVDMGLQIFQLERNGKFEGDSCDSPHGPCHEWMKDQQHCRVAELDPLGHAVRYLTPDECGREIALLRAYN
jgi:hypothetical protein